MFAAIIWRQAVHADMERVNQIADQIHVNLPERSEVFAEKARLFPEGCLVLVNGDEITGYGLAHPWILNNIPALDTFLEKLPPDPSCLFVHDVAILASATGRGASGVYIDRIASIARARQISYLALVSVYNTQGLWKRYGFRIVHRAELAPKLASYGGMARYMIRQL